VSVDFDGLGDAETRLGFALGGGLDPATGASSPALATAGGRQSLTVPETPTTKAAEIRVLSGKTLLPNAEARISVSVLGTRRVYRKFTRAYPTVIDHLWTTDPMELDATYALEAPAFFVFTEAGSGRRLLYRCQSATYGHFLSIDANCDVADQPPTDVLGYVATDAQPGLRALVRCHQDGPPYHAMSTVGPQECTDHGHVIDGVQGYVAP
jgi:hypothetical protein